MINKKLVKKYIIKKDWKFWNLKIVKLNYHYSKLLSLKC